MYMAKFISTKELKKRKSNLATILSISESISEIKTGCGWVLTGYSKDLDFDSLRVLNEGQHWNTLLQALPPDQICYAYVRVEFGKLPGGVYLIIWIGEDVKDETKLIAEANENLLPTLFPTHKDIIRARTRGNLQSQITGKLMPSRHVSLSKSPEKISEQEPLKRRFTVHGKVLNETIFSPKVADNIKSINTLPADLIQGKEIQAKVIVIGDGGVGKTSIIQKYAYSTNSEALNCKKEIYLKKEKIGKDIINLKIWDTIGDEKLETLAPIWYRYAEAAVLVYDKTNRQSFEHITQWLERIRTYSEPQSIILVGNKADFSKVEVVEKKEGFSYAFQNGLLFIETCAIDGTNITQLFSLLCRRLVPKLLELNEGFTELDISPVNKKSEGKFKRKKHTKILNTQIPVNIKLKSDVDSREFLRECFN